MSAWSDGYVHANGLRLHYYRTGGDKPKVIFNHGAGVSNVKCECLIE